MMIEWLKDIDEILLLAVNGAHHFILDHVMWIISGKIIWIPLAFALVWMNFKRNGLSSTSFLLLGVMFCFILADQLSVHLFKEMFQRYRPSHHLRISEHLHYHIFPDGSFYKSGQYGFISSHASNFFAVSTFIYLFLRKAFPKIIFILVPICILVGYSRVYLGVHYPSDVFVGGVFGILIGMLVYFVVRKFHLYYISKC